MHSDPRTAYLETQILTATPQKLRLMLIEGALRFAQRALDAFATGNREQSSEALGRCREIVSELLVSIRPQPVQLNRVSQEIYAFILRQVAEAELMHDEIRLRDAIRILKEERETWQQVCEVMPDAPPELAPMPEEILAPTSCQVESMASVSFDA